MSIPLKRDETGGSPDYPKLVTAALRIIREQCQRFHLSLRDQHAVKWVSMMAGELSSAEGVEIGDGQRLDAVLNQSIQQEFLRSIREGQSSECKFNGDFP